jgi:hypothetical protein
MSCTLESMEKPIGKLRPIIETQLRQMFPKWDRNRVKHAVQYCPSLTILRPQSCYQIFLNGLPAQVDELTTRLRAKGLVVKAYVNSVTIYPGK